MGLLVDGTQLSCCPPTTHLSHVCDFCSKRTWCESSRQPEAFYSEKVSWSIDLSVPFCAHDCNLYGCCTHACRCSSSKRCTHAFLDHNCSFRWLGTLRSYLFYLLGIMWSRCTSVGFFNLIDSAARLYLHSLLWRMQGQLEASAGIVFLYFHACTGLYCWLPVQPPHDLQSVAFSLMKNQMPVCTETYTNSRSSQSQVWIRLLQTSVGVELTPLLVPTAVLECLCAFKYN